MFKIFSAPRDHLAKFSSDPHIWLAQSVIMELGEDFSIFLGEAGVDRIFRAAAIRNKNSALIGRITTLGNRGPRVYFAVVDDSVGQVILLAAQLFASENRKYLREEKKVLTSKENARR